MAITNKEEGVWSLDEVYNKQNEGGIWATPASVGGPYKLFTWGSNAYGQLGQNGATGWSNGKSSPTQVGTGSDWQSIASSGNAGSEYTKSAVKTDGTLWVMGGNQYGALGQNNNSQYSSPVQIPGTTWKDPNGADRIIVTKTDGTLWSYGLNEYGRLGLNDNVQRSSPTQIPGTTWDASSSKSTVNGITASIKTDGTLWTWGVSTNGQTAQNDTINRSSPVQVPGTWSTISSGSQSVWGVKTDGTAWGWGRNEYGELGQNTRGAGGSPHNSGFSSPVQIGTESTWTNLTSGYGSCIGTKTDGTMWVWGWDQHGQLGLEGPSNVKYSSPVQLGTDTTWSTILGTVASMEYGVAAIKSDGTLWSWGFNNFGQLGQNNQAPNPGMYSSPKQVGTDTKWGRVYGTTGGVTALQDL